VSLRYALLGLLAEEPASGYDLTRKFEVLRRYAWHAQSSQIYPELGQLSKDGLVSIVERGARGRQTYAITEAGRAALREWLRHPPEVFTVRNEFVLRLFLLSALEPAEAREVLSQLAEDSAVAWAELSGEVAAFDAAADGPPPMRRLVAEYGLRSFQTLSEWAQWALERTGQPGRILGG
jgi:DNA-binding PadR family transcriptional regulator